MKLRGRGILITGANQGLGKAIARACVREGADVVLCARGRELLEATGAELSAEAASGQRVLTKAADVSVPEQVAALVEFAAAGLPQWEGLVNSAGVYGPIGPVEEACWAEWKQAIEINLFGTVLACREALSRFRKRGRGKIVNLSGGGATAPLPRFSAYAASKAAVVRFTETLAEEVQGQGIDVNAIAPGALNTRLLDQVLEAGPELAGERFYQRSQKQKQEGGVPPEKGAALAVFLLSEASDGITGRLLSAVWDPWEDLPRHAGELASSDVYTLRRIVPRDRGKEWGE